VDYFLKKKVIDKSKRKTLKENTSIEVFWHGYTKIMH
jgi:hypothetical protein